MAQDPRRWPAGAHDPYINQYRWLSGDDEEADSRDDYTANGQRAYATSFNSGAGHYVDPGLQTTDGRAGPYPYDPSSDLQSPYHPAVDSSRDPSAYYPPQRPYGPYGSPAESEPWDLAGQHEGRIDGSSLPGPYGHVEPQLETSEPFRGTPEMPQEQGRDSPRSIDVEQGSDEEFTARDPSGSYLNSRGHGYHLNLKSDLDGPWSPSVDQGRPNREEKARKTNTLFERSFSAVPSSSNGQEHK